MRVERVRCLASWRCSVQERRSERVRSGATGCRDTWSHVRCCCRDAGVQRGFAALLSLHLHGKVTKGMSQSPVRVDHAEVYPAAQVGNHVR